MRKLRPYQHCAVQYILYRFFHAPKATIRKGILTVQRFKYFILADEGGLGKTTTALTVLQEMADKHEGKLFLIICPSGLKPNWIDEIQNVLPEKEQRQGKYTILIETYNSVLDPAKARWLRSLKIDLLIIDEGHYLKSFNAKRTQIIIGAPGLGRQIFLKAKYIIDLTANPIANHVGEIYPFFWGVQSHVINDMTEDDFLTMFSEYWERTKFGLSVQGVKNEEKLLKNQLFYLRRTIDDVEHEIPKGTRIHYDIEITNELLKEEAEAENLLKDLLVSSGVNEFDIEDMLDDPDYFIQAMKTLPKFVQYAEFRKRHGLIKIKPVFEHLKESVIPEHDKFILSTVHRDVLKKYYELLTEYLKKIEKNIEIIVVHGGINKQKRHELLTRANSLEKCYLLVTIGAVREGHNLQKFRYTYNTELDWRDYVHKQFEYRTRRIGSTHAMFWYYYIFDKGIDKKVFDVISSKRETMNKIYNRRVK